MDRVTVCLVIDTYSFPTIFLVIKFQGCTIGGSNLVRWGVTRESTEFAPLVLLEERNVAKLELLGLLGIVASSFGGVLPNAQ